MKKTNRRKQLVATLVVLLIASVALICFLIQNVAASAKEAAVYKEAGLSFVSKTEGKDFYVYKDEKWEKMFLKGVNIGAAKPGYFPGELAITKEEYLRWFQYISEMNADVIRVYTTLEPAFYDALYEFNKGAEKPLYLMQGVWINEEDIAELHDAYADDGKIKNDFINDAKDLVDIFHGNANLPGKAGFASGEYTKDISQYVIGWILGIEWDPDFVDTTNANNPDRTSYSGEYTYTENASPFETFLCEVGDAVLTYEASEYQTTRALGFANWVTTDMLDHPSEPYEKEDRAVVNTEHIKAQEKFLPGLFASYHIYPYYPDFLSYEKDYITYKDEEGKVNTYRAYLRDLMKEHTIPVLVAEFGVPASRGKAHESLYSGYDQGQHDETEQGEIVADLLGDIYAEGYCGGLVFTWQDEWFKRTWNTMDFDLANRRAYWSNSQTNEQEFGLMAFDPGEEKSICYVDGDLSDWAENKPISKTKDGSLYVKSDEKYVYVLAKTKDFTFGEDSLYIPVDSLIGQGNAVDASNSLQFERPADFLIKISSEDDARILVDAYYDSFYYLYAEKLKMIEKNADYTVAGAGIFNPIYHCLSREIYLPEDQITVPFSTYETGKLSYGDANPGHEDFNSLTDFSVKDGNIEIRIPWQLLNVMDPSTKSIMGDLYKNKGVKAEQTDKMYFGMGVVKGGETGHSEIAMNAYSWDSWDLPTYHERLKPSYYILQDLFEKLQ